MDMIIAAAIAGFAGVLALLAAVNIEERKLIPVKIKSDDENSGQSDTQHP
jgi:hypothetical protein